MLFSLKKSFETLVLATTISAVTLTAGVALAETVTCNESDTNVSYRLQFDWKRDTVDISYRSGTAAYKKIFKSGTAVRNNANDKSFLAEGLTTHYTGTSKECGLVETLTFDVTGSNGTTGVLEKRGDFSATKSGCKAKMPAPDLSTNTVAITCSR